MSFPLVACGIPRSGSTLVWQIVQDLFPNDKIFKTHPAWAGWIPGESRTLLSIRDPRDVVASLYRVRLSRTGPNAGGFEGLKNVINRTKIYFHSIPSLNSFPHELLRYEDFVFNYSVIYRAIEKLTGIKISQHQGERLYQRYNVKANMRRASKLSNFNEIDEYGIHGDHIGLVDPGAYKRYLSWARKTVEEECEEICKEWGYENSN